MKCLILQGSSATVVLSAACRIKAESSREISVWWKAWGTWRTPPPSRRNCRWNRLYFPRCILCPIFEREGNYSRPGTRTPRKYCRRIFSGVSSTTGVGNSRTTWTTKMSTAVYASLKCEIFLYPSVLLLRLITGLTRIAPTVEIQGNRARVIIDWVECKELAQLPSCKFRWNFETSLPIVKYSSINNILASIS